MSFSARCCGSEADFEAAKAVLLDFENTSKRPRGMAYFEDRTRQLVLKNWPAIDALAKALLDYETLDHDDAYEVIEPFLKPPLHSSGGATWVSLHHGGGVGMVYSQHAGVVIVCDGTDAAATRIARVLWNDPATGVMRHADAGYPKAIEVAKAKGLNLPMQDG